MNYRNKYTYHVPYGSPYHDWSLICRWGGLNLHIVDHGEKHAREYGDRYSGGLEIHYRQPPAYKADDPPSHDACWLLQCPCWHDGTSLYVSEQLIPFWREGETSHDAMFRRLESEAADRFSEFTSGGDD